MKEIPLTLGKALAPLCHASLDSLDSLPCDDDQGMILREMAQQPETLRDRLDGDHPLL